MRLESAIALKSSLVKSELSVAAAIPAAATARGNARRGESATATPSKRFPLAIGVTGRKQEFRLAVRVQKTEPGLEAVLEEIRRRAKVKWRFDTSEPCSLKSHGTKVAIGPCGLAAHRPCRHHGRYARLLRHAARAGGTEDWILSNNHVLANENLASIGDTILQPGDADGGRKTKDAVGKLEKSIRLKKKNNRVDAAVANIEEEIEDFYNELATLGEIAGVRTDPLDEGETVYKVGRTTGVTKGRVSAIELDSLEVGYDIGVLEFDGQIEIEPFERVKPFSLGGDSGSLIVDSKRRAVALLFAGNDVDSTYANPIGQVLDALKVDLVY